ncbi:MAG: DEAD/DEAH box helicase [Lentimicrobium sp.]|jgi:ATP-dependent exoDNAse (exonuclease V) alpha subunit|nr:DEAD/DEAH box helicase [Lentimicrobium sp.]
MVEKVGNIQVDPDNEEFRYAAEIAEHTNKLLFVTGKAGTGKTTFLKYLTSTTVKNMVVLAPTGVAAVNAGGQTIHSFFNIKPSIYFPGDKRLRTFAPPEDPDRSVIHDHFRYNRDKLDVIRGLELLIIDEISMVRSDLFDVIDRLLRVFRKREFTPFGGVQLILIGDTFQLPPIVNQDDWNILGRFYDSPFFFSSRAMQKQKPIYIELKKIYRQKEQDFIDLLNRVRINTIDLKDIQLLNSRYLHGFTPEEEDDYIILATHNRMVEETNNKRLHEIDEPIHRFEATVIGQFPENSYPADMILKLKEGAQVMFLRNDRNKRYYNGKIGHVVEISEEGLFVALPEGDIIEVAREEWENIRYTWDNGERKVVEEIIGSFVQYPLKLAWAITVHKSQGLTFDKIIADLEEAFAPGQVYVALSRCTSFAGLLLKTPLNARSIKTDPVVLEFAKNETPSTLLATQLEVGKSENYLKRALNAYLQRDYGKSASMILKAFEVQGFNQTRTTLLVQYAFKRAGQKTLTILEKIDSTLNATNEKPLTEIFQPEALMLLERRKTLRKLETRLKDQIHLLEELQKLRHTFIHHPNFVIDEEANQSEQIRKLEMALDKIKREKKKLSKKNDEPR